MDTVKKKILVVDDEPDVVDVIKLRLEASGFEVVVAYDGKEALDRVVRENPAAVLLDIMMPEVDGLNVLKRIRERDKKLPIFMITGLSNKEGFEMARRFGASGFIMKTADLKVELDNIINLLNISGKYKGV